MWERIRSMLKFILPKPLFLRRNGKRGFGGLLWGGRESKNMADGLRIASCVWTSKNTNSTSSRKYGQPSIGIGKPQRLRTLRIPMHSRKAKTHDIGHLAQTEDEKENFSSSQEGKKIDKTSITSAFNALHPLSWLQ